jgi:hypothetical protein
MAFGPRSGARAWVIVGASAPLGCAGVKGSLRRPAATLDPGSTGPRLASKSGSELGFGLTVVGEQVYDCGHVRGAGDLIDELDIPADGAALTAIVGGGAPPAAPTSTSSSTSSATGPTQRRRRQRRRHRTRPIQHRPAAVRHRHPPRPHPRSAILDYGTTTGTIPAPLYNALVVRDRHCRFPGCDRPAAGAKATTSTPGTPAAPPNSPTWCCCAAATTTSSTGPAGTPNSSPTPRSKSPTPPDTSTPATHQPTQHHHSPYEND